MSWKLWLDDQLDDPETPIRHTPEGFLGAKSSAEAVKLVIENGLPEHVDLDHDLGDDDTARDFLMWLVEHYPEGPVPSYAIHSQNPVGVMRLKSFMESWARAIQMEAAAPKPWAIFYISEEEGQVIRAFLDEHNAIHRGKDGAIGGRFTYSFTPTSLGQITCVKCACGAKINATNFEDW